MALASPKNVASIPDPVRVMVVDDSAVVRGLITRFLQKDGTCDVVASASNGENALRTLARHDVEVIVLDIEMPVMDGLTALPLLLKAQPSLQIVMASTLSIRNAKIGLQALELGAQDYIPKPSTSADMRADEFADELLRKVTILGKRARRKSGVRVSAIPKVETLPAATPQKTVEKPLLYRDKEIELRSGPVIMPKLIAIGSSTGGPSALSVVLKSLSADVKQPILITQHMPATFTTILAQRLEKDSGRPCKEGVDGEPIVNGHIYVAPGDYHMMVVGSAVAPKIQLLQTPAENYCRPAVDPMLRSLGEIYGAKVLTVILTGMGQDGLLGCRKLVEMGSTVVAQDEESSTVWGMPGAVATDGLCHSVKPLEKIANEINKIATLQGDVK